MKAIPSELGFLLKHSSVYGLGNLLSRAVAFVLLPLYTRYLTPADYGVLELVDATSALAMVTIGLGISGSVARFYYDLDPNGRRRLIGTVYALAFASCVIAAFPLMSAAPWLAIHVLDGAKYTSYFRIGFAALLVGTVEDIGLLQLRLRYQSTLFIVISILNLVLGVALNVVFIVWLGSGALGVLTASLITKLTIGLPMTLVILAKTGLHFSPQLARPLLAYSLPLIPSSLAGMMSSYTERYCLKYFVSIAETGIFGLARKISGSVHLLLTAPFITTFLPRRFEIALTADAPRVLSAVYDAFFLMLLVPCAFVAVFGREVMVLMTTPAYYRAADVLPILLLETLALGSRYHVEFGVLYAKKTKYYLYVNTLVTVVIIVLDLILIRFFGMWGAASASLAGALLQAALLHYVSKKYYAIPFAFPRQFKVLCLAAALVVVSRWIVVDSLVTVIGIKMGLYAAFLLALACLHGVRPTDLAGVRRAVAAALGRATR